jgi:hypothetical protein
MRTSQAILGYGVKQGVNDPQPTKLPSKSRSAVGLPQCYLPVRSMGETSGETARVHHTVQRGGSGVADNGAGAAAGCAWDRVPAQRVSGSLHGWGGAHRVPSGPEGVRLHRGGQRFDRIPLGRGPVRSVAGVRHRAYSAGGGRDICRRISCGESGEGGHSDNSDRIHSR